VLIVDRSVVPMMGVTRCVLNSERQHELCVAKALQCRVLSDRGFEWEDDTVEDTAIPADLRDLDRLREKVRTDRRTVVAPLVVFGLLGVLHAAAWIAAVTPASRHVGLYFFWPLASAAGLIALWLHARRIAERRGVGEGPRSYRPIAIGYLVSLPLLAALFVPAFLIGVFAPLVWPAVVLWAAAIRQRSAELRRAAKLLAAAGLVQGLLVVVAWSTEADVVLGWLSVGVDLMAAVGMLIAARLTAGRARVH
jgi:hypothetical protein